MISSLQWQTVAVDCCRDVRRRRIVRRWVCSLVSHTQRKWFVNDRRSAAIALSIHDQWSICRSVSTSALALSVAAQHCNSDALSAGTSSYVF